MYETNFATNDYDLYTQLACFIDMIIYDPIGCDYYIHMCVLDIVYQWGNTGLMKTLITTSPFFYTLSAETLTFSMATINYSSAALSFIVTAFLAA